MTEGIRRREGGPRLVELVVAGSDRPWVRAGFSAASAPVFALGTVDLRCEDADRTGRGITGWALSGIDLDGHVLDGLPTTVVPSVERPEAPPHANGVIGLDHVVVATPDLDRTLGAFAAAGLELRRIRDTTAGGAPLRQAFFRLGPTVLEVVSGGDLAAGSGPATFWGLAVDVADLDATAAHLGAGLGRIKAAVQPGRRIATFRRDHLDLPVAIAAMDRLGTAPDGDR